MRSVTGLHRALRLALALALAWALPLQGIATAAMVGCGLDSLAAHSASAGHADMHAAHHAHAATPAEPRVAPHAPAKCSVCAACCTAAAIVQPQFAFDSSNPAESFAAVEPLRRAVFLTAGLERPPRPFLA